jgi:hypothetical protein
MRYFLLYIIVFFCNYSHSIVNGSPVLKNKFLNTVFITNSITESRCTGTIIQSDNQSLTIETAAHCIYEFTNFDILLQERNMRKLLLGSSFSDKNVRIKSDSLYNEKLQFMKKGIRVYIQNDKGGLEKVDVESVEINPIKLLAEKTRLYRKLKVEDKNAKFKHDYFSPDLAIIKTKKNEFKNSKIAKISINDIIIGDIVHTMGYGVSAKNFKAGSPKKKKNIDSDSIGVSPELAYSLGSIVKISEFGKVYIIGNNIDGKYQSPCYGDSGGGNYIYRSGEFLYLGVTSDMGSKKGCGVPSIGNENNKFLPKTPFTHSVEISR